ncbi:Tir chaperone protein (CesT) [Bordetella ansorpii]|uniref:Tir chaperone protein (CesT) n=1 Tax=Bordetella ansorpii TaxID=288768 RepID=A0A157RG58_9BORD|nr:type III secretion system chaperone [Bordetella ansorpii]SAI56916.1 Tir chaperone protein (CesT) [Bordetella ansorpii]
MNFSRFIDELNARLSGAAQTAGQSAQLLTLTLPASGIEITLESLHDGQVCAVSGLICRYPPDAQRLALFDRLMQAHAYGVVTDGAYFAASAQAGKVVLAKVLPLEGLSFDQILALLETFAGHYQAWRVAYDAGQLTGESASPAAAPIPAPVFNMA